ncbi:MAG: hypothetical protein RL596_1582, partial [Bacteroidota bacterium]
MKRFSATLSLYLIASTLIASTLIPFTLTAQQNNYSDLIIKNASKVEQKVIEWRHDIHQH